MVELGVEQGCSSTHHLALHCSDIGYTFFQKDQGPSQMRSLIGMHSTRRLEHHDLRGETPLFERVRNPFCFLVL